MSGDNTPITGDNDLGDLTKVFGKAWHLQDSLQTGDDPIPGARTRAGLRAVFEELESDGYILVPSGSAEHEAHLAAARANGEVAGYAENIAQSLSTGTAQGRSNASRDVQGLTIAQAREALDILSGGIQSSNERVNTLAEAKRLIKRELLGETREA